MEKQCREGTLTKTMSGKEMNCSNYIFRFLMTSTMITSVRYICNDNWCFYSYKRGFYHKIYISKLPLWHSFGYIWLKEIDTLCIAVLDLHTAQQHDVFNKDQNWDAYSCL